MSIKIFTQRRDRLKINRVQGLREIKEDLRQILKENHTLAADDLELVATHIYNEATALVPVRPASPYYDDPKYPERAAERKTLQEPVGTLRDSIDVSVSYSPRYPGIIAVASARNPNTGYDYAPNQEENDDYRHTHGQAHFLEEPFRKNVEEFLRKRGW